MAQSVCTAENLPGTVHTTLTASPVFPSGFVGVPVGYAYTETNDGTRPLTNVTVTDDNCAPVTRDSSSGNNDAILDPGETWFFSCTMVPDSPGILVSQVTATGTDPVTGQVHLEQATAEVNLLNMPFWDEASGMWIDPSGTTCPSVRARVTLFRAATAGGPFQQVPAGSVIMSPDNRENPDTVAADGSFRWDVVAGFYRIRLTSLDTGESVDTAVFPIPPPVTDIDLSLPCPTKSRAPLDRTG